VCTIVNAAEPDSAVDAEHAGFSSELGGEIEIVEGALQRDRPAELAA
jgi:hypothetical protein